MVWDTVDTTVDTTDTPTEVIMADTGSAKLPLMLGTDIMAMPVLTDTTDTVWDTVDIMADTTGKPFCNRPQDIKNSTLSFHQDQPKLKHFLYKQYHLDQIQNCLVDIYFVILNL